MEAGKLRMVLNSRNSLNGVKNIFQGCADSVHQLLTKTSRKKTVRTKGYILSRDHTIIVNFYYTGTTIN